MKSIIISVIMFLFIFYSNSSFSKMMPRTNMSIAEYISYTESKIKSGELSESRRELYKLTIIMNKLLNISTVSFHSGLAYNNRNIADLSKVYQLGHLLYAAENEVSKACCKMLSGELKKIILNNQPLLNKKLKHSPLVLSWYLMQKDEKLKSQAVLIGLFDKQFSKTMKLKVVVTGLGRHPLGRSRAILKMINNVSNIDIQKDYKEKMRQMEVHISKLPVSKIVT